MWHAIVMLYMAGNRVNLQLNFGIVQNRRKPRLDLQGVKTNSRPQESVHERSRDNFAHQSMSVSGSRGLFLIAMRATQARVKDIDGVRARLIVDRHGRIVNCSS